MTMSTDYDRVLISTDRNTIMTAAAAAGWKTIISNSSNCRDHGSERVVRSCSCGIIVGLGGAGSSLRWGTDDNLTHRRIKYR